MADFAKIWQGADKVVYSTTLEASWTSRTRLERRYEAAVVRDLKTSASSDLAIGGANLGASAFREGLIDEVHLSVGPVAIGGGKSALPDQRLNLELIDEQRFGGGTIFLRYRVEGHPGAEARG